MPATAERLSVNASALLSPFSGLGDAWEWVTSHWSPAGVTVLIVALVALLALPRLVPLLSTIAGGLKDRAASRRADAEAAAGIVATLRVELRDTLAEQAALRDRLDAAEAAEEACRRDLAGVSARLAQVEAVLPFALTAERLRDWLSLRDTLDAAAEPWVISSPAEEGRLLYVNRAFAAELGMTQAEVVAAGWRALIDPGSLEAAKRAEAAAWVGDVTPVTVYRRKGGGTVAFRWFARYSPEVPVALALARVVERSA